MGQRFQIVINTDGKIRIYHCQWLWGDYAIRRLGTAVRNFLRAKYKYCAIFEDYLKGSFYGKPNDMNSFYRYDNESSNYSTDNKWIVGEKKYAWLEPFLETLDNNDGFFYLEIGEKNQIKGYCFMRGYVYPYWDMKPITADDYMKNYGVHQEFSKKQKKEYEDGLKTFSKLPVVQIPREVKP